MKLLGASDVGFYFKKVKKKSCTLAILSNVFILILFGFCYTKMISNSR